MQPDKKKDRPKTSIYQKLNTFADWFIRLVMINILVIITSLPLITIYPALYAGYRLFDDYINQEETGLFKGYVTYLKEGFVKKLGLGTLLIFLIAFGYWNVTYYVNQLNADAHWFYTVGYYVTFAALIGVFAVTLYTFVVLHKHPSMSLKVLFKLCFYLSGKFVLRTILLIIIMVLPYAMLLSPITFLLFVFFGLSTPLLLYAVVTTPVKHYVEGLENLS